MRVLFFVVKMLVIVFLLGVVVRIVSTAVFRPKPIETIPDRYAAETVTDPSGINPGPDKTTPARSGVEAETVKREDSGPTERPKEQPGKNLSKDAEIKSLDVNIHEYLKESGLTRLIPEKYISQMEKIPLKDKLAGISLFAKINASDKEELLKLIRDGVGEDEYENVNQILARSLEEKDLVKLREIVLRYAGYFI